MMMMMMMTMTMLLLMMMMMMMMMIGHKGIYYNFFCDILHLYNIVIAT